MHVALEPWMRLWNLTPAGEAFTTRWGSVLAPVLCEGRAAMLKFAPGEEEANGAALLEWLGGDGAARVYARQGPALVLERLSGPRSLAAMARSGDDAAAMRILARTAAWLHAPRPTRPPASLVPLPVWFKALEAGGPGRGGLFAHASRVAADLLAAPRDVRPLHGDIHHGNVLDGGTRGWLAIDPKGLLGEPGFDYANMVCNPDAATATAPGVLERRLAIVAEASGQEPRRALAWVVAWCGLSAIWTLEAGGDAREALAVGAQAAALLES
jgi:streptomycin 6-kinase